MRTLFVSALFAMPSLVNAQKMVVEYTCNVGGVPASLVAQIQVIGGAGIVQDGQGNITGVIEGQGGTTYVAGEMRSPTAYYTFRGENDLADFTDHSTGARFTVQWVPQSATSMIVVVNPFERAGPRSFVHCQRVK